MTHIQRTFILTLLTCSMQVPGFAYEALDDLQLDKVVAGASITETPAELARIPIMLSKSNGNSLEGEIILQRVASRASGSLILQDGAQSNLQSLININAVNSPVNVLLNLNININSNVGVLEQLNLQGRL